MEELPFKNLGYVILIVTVLTYGDVGGFAGLRDHLGKLAI